MIEVRTPAAPVETVTPIKPSEAIRLGCLTTAQVFGDYDKGPDTACVLQAMAVGYGVERGAELDAMRTHPAYPAAILELGNVGGCPVCHAEGSARATVHLNDDHRWSRERIADWLEGLGL